MNQSNNDAELASLLQDLCEIEQGERIERGDLENRLDQLSESELADLLGAGQCLNLLQKLNEGDASGNEMLKTLVGKITSPITQDDDCPLIPESIGHYEIIRLWAKGGFAKIYQARDPRLDRIVALKVPLAEHLDYQASRERFEREAKAVAMLTHPAIVPVYEAGSVDGVMYIAFQWVPGKNLHDWLKAQESPLNPIETAKAVKKIAEAVAYAHSKGILHRDIKPANVLLDDTECESKEWYQRVRVTDFGLAKSLEIETPEITIDGAILGTPSYMSPEQIRSEPNVGPAADVFALGNILYELLTGVRPHHKSDWASTVRAIESEAPLPVTKFRKDVPGDLVAICNHCLQKNPADRYPTAFELVEDLSRFETGYSVLASPPSVRIRTQRWLARNRWLALGLSTIFIGLFSGLLVILSMKNAAVDASEKYRNQLVILESIFKDLNHDRDGAILDEASLRDRLAKRLAICVETIDESSDRELGSSLLGTLSETLITLDRPDESRKAIEKAIRLAGNHQSREHELTLQVQLARSLVGQEKYEEVSEILDPILDELVNNQEIPAIRIAEALSYDAESHFQRAFQSAAEVSVARSAWNNLLRWLPTSSLNARSQSRHRVLAEFRVAHCNYIAETNPKTLQSMQNAFDRYVEIYGEDYNGSIRAAYGLVIGLRDEGQHETALEMAERFLKVSTAKYGETDLNTLLSLDSVTVSCGGAIMVGKTEEHYRKRLAEVLPRAVAAYQQKLVEVPEFYKTLLPIYRNAAICWKVLEEPEKSLEIQRQLVNFAQAAEGSSSPQVWDQKFTLAVELLEQGSEDEALELLRKYLSAAKEGIQLPTNQVGIAKQKLGVKLFEAAKHP